MFIRLIFKRVLSTSGKLELVSFYHLTLLLSAQKSKVEQPNFKDRRRKLADVQ